MASQAVHKVEEGVVKAEEVVIAIAGEAEHKIEGLTN
jgi:hypothetical protein